MPPYHFRLRVNLSDQRFSSVDEVVEIGALPDGGTLRLRSGNRGVSIKDSDRVAFLGGPFDSEIAARAAASETRARFLQWAVRYDVGVDWGGGSPEGVFTTAGLEHFAKELGSPVRPDVHGVDVYEHVPDIRFIAIRTTASFTTDIDTFRVELQAPAKPMTRKQQLAAEIFTSHRFDTSPRSRFLTLMTAIEALLDPQERGAEAQAVVAVLLRTVAESSLNKSTKDSMKGAIEWLRSESIGQSGRRLATALLSGRQYDGKPPAAFFSDIYEIRSGIVHRGASPKGMLALANTTQEFVRDLLLASIEAGPSRAATKDEIELAAYLRWRKRMELAEETPLDDWLVAERDLS